MLTEDEGGNVQKAGSIALLVVSALLAILFIIHFAALITKSPEWVSSGDWLSLGKRILTTFVLGALSNKAYDSGMRRLKGEKTEIET